ncbi:hypothetical protein LUZ61_000340 [Rhynchospora tenuis]|uniref:Cytochrome P450 n=1 Tax=Rhynchospora tenuis TaxID=198213 RepID=A0AAD5ZEV1_9POAL|nr:hypothetical protein LUZ61_000340 [Rhynchospora tenuis]
MEAQDYFSKWQDWGTVDLVHELEHLITLTTARCLLGREIRENINEEVPALVCDIAGKFSTAKAAVWTGAYLLQHKTHLSKALEEQKALLGRHGSKIDFDILREMDVLYRCIKEAIRIGPPPIIIPRYCRKSFTITTKEGNKYMIPKGHIVATSPRVANHADHVFKDPDRYDPDRYLSAEGKEMASQSFSYTSFGGGRHTCPGEVFAYMKLKIIWCYLIRNFELNLASVLTEGEWNGTDKILVHYKRR